MSAVRPLPVCSSACLPGVARRGGARPGAGAPRGNINALVDGRYSRRFAAAAWLLRVVLTVAPAAVDLPSEPRARRRRTLQYLRAARRAIRDFPSLPQQIEDYVLHHLGLEGCTLPSDSFVRLAVRPRLQGPAHLRRALDLLAYVFHFNPEFARLITETPFFAPILNALRTQPETGPGTGQDQPASRL